MEASIASVQASRNKVDQQRKAKSERTKFNRRRLPLSKKLFFSLIPVCALLLLAELLARIVVSIPEGGSRFSQIEQIVVYLGNKPGDCILAPDPTCFWTLKPNAILPDNGDAAWSGRMSNSHGHRSRETSREDAESRLRVLCFGDSSTFAFGVRFEDAWPNQLQELFDEKSQGTVEILNAGVPGQTSFQGRHRLTRELQKWKPHLAIITFGNNDGWRWDDRTDKEHAARIARNALWNNSRAWYWLTTSRQQVGASFRAPQDLKWAQDATWNYFDPNTSWRPRVSVVDFEDNLVAMINECREHECQPVLVVWPDQRQLLGQPTWRPPYQQAMRKVAKAASVDCLDLVPLFEEKHDWAVERFLPRDVVHLDREGNAFVSAAVSQIVQTRFSENSLARKAE